METRKDFEDGKLARLDFKVDVVDDILVWWYSQKSIRNPW